MGTDIHGWVEAKLPFYEEGGWQQVIGLFWLYDVRDYDAFGCFFGVRNYAQFRPIAPERGLPADVSLEVKQDAARWGNEAFGHTWIIWDEITQIDWDEESEHVDQRVHEYRRNQQGELVFTSKAWWSREFAERVGYEQCVEDQEQAWDLGEVVYRRVRMKRKEIKADWEVLFHFLQTLAARYGDDHVRLVVWFDS
jgi:hypothetical protein